MGFLRTKADRDWVVRDGETAVSVTIRRDPRAVRLTLRLSPRGEGAVLTAPTAVSERALAAFLEAHRDWLIAAFRAAPAAQPFIDGARIPVQDGEVLLRHDPKHRGRGTVAGDTLTIGGGVDFFPRRVRDWLRSTARSEIGTRVRDKAASAQLRPGRITLRDQTTRWGSCAANGNLSFSWRLICAPTKVLDYVVAHEVAHLAHMNHSPAFWRLAESLSEDMPAARNWLRAHGAALHRIGG